MHWMMGLPLQLPAPWASCSNADSPPSTTREEPYDLEITHIRPVEGARGETEYILSATHYFFVWPVESTICVRADNHPLLKKRI